MNDKFEALLREAATEYVEKEGAKLISEPSETVPFADYSETLRRGRCPRRPARRTAKQLRRFAYIALPAAACIIIAFLLFRPGAPSVLPHETGTNDTPPLTASATQYPRVEVKSLAEKLPAGCKLTGTDYDNGKTIYHIENELGSGIVLIAEKAESRLMAESFTPEQINGTQAYLFSRPDYSVLFAQSGGVQYTLTGEFGTGELVKIAEKIL